MTAGLAEQVAGPFHFEAVSHGPTWQTDEHGDFVLPELTLGYQVIAWIQGNLLNDEAQPFQLTDEQFRFILWWYAVDETGRFIYRDGVLQRLKGWGKDPLGAVLSAVEFVGPCRFSHWATEDFDGEEGVVEGDPLWPIGPGDPVAKGHPRAWIQIAAVSKDQTRNTMTLMPGLFTKKCISEHRIDIGKEIIYAYGGQRRLEAVTSSPRALEGGRPTFVLRNETHHWLVSNEGHAMAAVIRRNLTKAKGGQARALSITNAYEPSEDSTAQHQREAWENEVAGLSIWTGVMYDSLEAPEDARMGPIKRDDGTMPTDDEVKSYIGAVIRAVRGDATWLDVDGIVAAILDRNNPPSQSRRFYYNQIVATEDAWADPAAVKAAIDPLARDARAQHEADQLRSGWLVMPSDEIAMFFDGSKNDDSTGLMGCRLSDGYVFTIGVWQRPAGEPGKIWLAPREEVDKRVDEAFERFKIVAFWGDPSHTKDDDATRYWDGYLDRWHRKYKDRLREEFWAVKTGDKQHSIMWDMTSPERSGLFTAAAETFIEELEREGDEGFEPAFRIDGHPALVDHIRNAKRYPNKWGISLWKGSRDSAKKVDLAVCAVGARMLRRLILNKGLEEEQSKAGHLWGDGPAGRDMYAAPSQRALEQPRTGGGIYRPSPSRV